MQLTISSVKSTHGLLSQSHFVSRKQSYTNSEEKQPQTHSVSRPCIHSMDKQKNRTKLKRQRPSLQNKRVQLICRIKIARKEKIITVDPKAYQKELSSYRGRRSLRLANRKSRNEDIFVEKKNKMLSSDVQFTFIEEHRQLNSNELCLPSLGQDSWCDLYHPHQSSEVIGNQAPVHQLYSWLLQWKDKCNSTNEAKLRTSTQDRNQSSTKSKTTPNDDDLDFKETKSHVRMCPLPSSGCFYDSVISCDKEDDDCGMALILSGGYGYGKTASVMACAEELGFKVCVYIYNVHTCTHYS